MVKRGVRLVFLTGALWLGGVVLICSPGVAGAQNISFIAPRIDYPVGARPGSVVVADFNGDGKLDLAVANHIGVSVLLGNGDGTFGPAVFFGTGLGPLSVMVGDFNSDGKLDLAVANSESNNVTVLINNTGPSAARNPRR